MNCHLLCFASFPTLCIILGQCFVPERRGCKQANTLLAGPSPHPRNTWPQANCSRCRRSSLDRKLTTSHKLPPASAHLVCPKSRSPFRQTDNFSLLYSLAVKRKPKAWEAAEGSLISLSQRDDTLHALWFCFLTTRCLLQTMEILKRHEADWGGGTCTVPRPST